MLREIKKIKLSNNERKLVENGWGYEVANNATTFQFFYNSGNNNVKGYLSYTKEATEKYPIVIWNRGGNGKSGMLDDFLASGILGEIASWGYIVFSSQYREKDEFGGDDVNDIFALINEAKAFELSDENRIGMEGWSRGGMMSYLTLKGTAEIKTCIIVAGLADLIKNQRYDKKLAAVYKKHFGIDDKMEFEKRLKERSAVYWADKISSKTSILFIHGTDDKKITPEDSETIYKELSRLNPAVKYELRLINGGDHYLKKEKKEIAHLRKNWLESNLKFNS